jgi:spore maturation protein A
MLNYIWAGLIVVSLLFALIIDVRELAGNRFRNTEELPVEIEFGESGYQTDTRRFDINVVLDSARYNAFYGTEGASPDSAYGGTLVRTKDGLQVQFGGGDQTARLPETLNLVRRFSADSDELETAPVRSTALQEEDFSFNADSTRASTSLGFNPVRFRKLRDISRAALNAAEGAASLALGLIGVLALFLGLLQIADEAGIIYSLTGLVQPVLRPLFPRVPDGHPAMAMVSLNLLANVFGLGNAATPLGIKAMEELQSLNPTEGTATDAMVMLLALNTSSVQLVPPVLLVAIMGLQINQLIFSITLATLCSSIVGAASAYFLARSRWFRSSSPIRQAGDVTRDSQGRPLDAGSEESDVRTDEDEE